MIEVFLIPFLASVIVMLFCHHCMSGEDFPFAGLFTFIAGLVGFGASFLLMLLYTIVKAVLS